MSVTHSPKLELPYLQAAQSQKHVTVNQSLQRIDSLVQLSAISRSISTIPLDPENGSTYLIPAAANDDWSDKEDTVAVWQDNAWLYFPPKKGWRIWIEDESLVLVWDGSNWVGVPVSATQIQNIEQIGINGNADATNRLFVNSSSVTFNTDDEDIRCILNKNSSNDTASVLFQSAFSGRAEAGLPGNDDFTLKVSADGSSWQNAITIDNSSAECNLHAPLALPQYLKASLPDDTLSGRIIYVSDTSGGPSVAYCDGSDWRRISDNSIIN